MGVIRVLHNENYTTMSNYHLRDSRLSLRAMGLMSKMLSLPDDWDYTVAGLAAICKEGREAVRKVLQELEETGYLERDQSREGGRFSGYDYTLHEEPIRRTDEELTPEEETRPGPEAVPAPPPSPGFLGNGGPPSPEKPLPRNPLPENPPQLNNEITKGLKNREVSVEIPVWMPKDVFDAIVAYCAPDMGLLAAWMGYAKMRQRIKKPVATVETVYRNCAVLDKYSKGDRAYKIGMLHKAEDCSWRGLFPLKEGDEGYNAAAGTDRPAQGEANERRPERWN